MMMSPGENSGGENATNEDSNVASSNTVDPRASPPPPPSLPRSSPPPSPPVETPSRSALMTHRIISSPSSPTKKSLIPPTSPTKKTIMMMPNMQTLKDKSKQVLEKVHHPVESAKQVAHAAAAAAAAAGHLASSSAAAASQLASSSAAAATPNFLTNKKKQSTVIVEPSLSTSVDMSSTIPTASTRQVDAPMSSVRIVEQPALWVDDFQPLSSVPARKSRSHSGGSGSKKRRKSTKSSKVSAASRLFEFVSSLLPTLPPLQDNDDMILGVVVASIAIMETWSSLHDIWHTQTVPLNVVGAWMLVAFFLGMQVDGKTVVEEIKANLLGPGLSKTTSTSMPVEIVVDSTGTNALLVVTSTAETTTTKSTPRVNPLRMLTSAILQQPNRPADTSIAVVKSATTSLKRSASVQEQLRRNMQFSHSFARKLSQFAKRKALKEEETEPMLAPTKEEETTRPSQEEESSSPDHSTHGMGRMDSDLSQATVLLTKMNVVPLGNLRGIDIFLSDCAEAELSTHPFLIRNGLHDVPTFMINMMTQWGTILVYLELPAWVREEDGWTEKETDPDDVKALKRFLSGNDEYRRQRLKIIPELVQAPYAVRLMAPSGVEIQLEKPGLVETSYYACPDPICCWEVTFDFMGNPAIRGMASLVKRYLASMSVDFALVISKPDGQVEDEPHAMLGLWRFDHVNVSQYPPMPDRFEIDDEEKRDEVQASRLVKEASKRVLVAAGAS